MFYPKERQELWINNLNNIVKELKEQVKNLKCCGNCKFNEDKGGVCELLSTSDDLKVVNNSYCGCQHWESDEITKEHRYDLAIGENFKELGYNYKNK